MIILYITLWLLSGFLAAWIDHKYVCGEELDTTLLLTLFITACGVPFLLITLASTPYFKRLITNPVVFKAKEPK